METVAQAARAYYRLGWCMIPIQPGTKKPAIRSWKEYQTRRPKPDTLRRWFDEKGRAIAIVVGEVSAGLVVRDFDRMASYDRWSAKHPNLAQTLPTVETGRPGRHVYFRADVDQICQQSRTGGGILTFEDGELRAAGAYCLAPPSKHPNGPDYSWAIAPTAEIPFIDPFSMGMVPCNREDGGTRENRRGQREQKSPEDIYGQTDSQTEFVSISSADLNALIARTLPNGVSQRHRLLFDLARELKAIPGLADAPGTALRKVIKVWHKRALPYIQTKAFEETWFDFLESWDKVKYPKGEGPMAEAMAKAVKAELPNVAQQYEQNELRLLVALCRELQRGCGEGPFFLSTRTAGSLLDVNHTTASRWLKGLCHDGILRLVERGSQETRKASRFRYLHSL